MDNQQVTLIELGWLAGIFDGESWIGFTLNGLSQGIDVQNRQGATVKVEIKINNTDPLIVQRTAEIFRKLGVEAYVREVKPSDSVKNRVFEVSTKHMKTVELLLKQLQPYLVGEKKERASLMLRFIELRRDAPGVENPAYANGRKGRHGPRTLKPYTEEEIAIIERCRELQVRGTSETTRERRNAAVDNLKRWNKSRQQ